MQVKGAQILLECTGSFCDSKFDSLNVEQTQDLLKIKKMLNFASLQLDQTLNRPEQCYSPNDTENINIQTDLIENVVSFLAEKAKNNQVTVRTEIKTPAVEIQVDEVRAQLALLGLLEYSLDKACEESTVTVTFDQLNVFENGAQSFELKVSGKKRNGLHRPNLALRSPSKISLKECVSLVELLGWSLSVNQGNRFFEFNILFT